MHHIIAKETEKYRDPKEEEKPPKGKKEITKIKTILCS